MKWHGIQFDNNSPVGDVYDEVLAFLNKHQIKPGYWNVFSFGSGYKVTYYSKKPLAK